MPATLLCRLGRHKWEHTADLEGPPVCRDCAKEKPPKPPAPPPSARCDISPW
jgi:hypothetical protein